MQLDPSARAILEGPNFGHLATIMPDGSPQVTPVWVDTDGQHLLVNTAEGRLKLRNVRRDPRVALDVTDASNPYRMVAIRGRVVGLREADAESHIHRLSQKYTGKPYPLPPGERRVVMVVAPERVTLS